VAVSELCCTARGRASISRPVGESPLLFLLTANITFNHCTAFHKQQSNGISSME
jgi:hypothetical protein